ncbi:hypothetical protein [Streptomyces sp. NPDC059003]|uniref:hypothetical protein n=1 Tax=Streptomyces sp. NPDC059003 TaxID=3346691 RepID=UPI0036786A55
MDNFTFQPHATPLDVKGRICVTPPYFALTELCSDTPGEATAFVPVEASPGRQASDINITEVGRHLAILGLCAASSLNESPGRHYYLARSARGEWLAPYQEQANHPNVGFQGWARASFENRCQATARTRLTRDDGIPIAQMQVDYQVMSQSAFAHFFGQPQALPLGAPYPNPYGQPPPLKGVKVHEGGASAELDVTPMLCPGHFDGYPALPVAFTSTAMTTLIDHFVARGDEAARWLPVYSELEAEQLPWAGKRLTITATPATGKTTDSAILCVAQIDGNPITTMAIDILTVTSGATPSAPSCPTQ